MLALTRRKAEELLIGDDIIIKVVEIRGDKVKLGITAPTKIAVHRREVYEAIRAEAQAALGVDAISVPVSSRLIRPAAMVAPARAAPAEAGVVGGKGGGAAMKTYAVERQARPRQRFYTLAENLTLMQGSERLAAAVRRAAVEYNRSTNALRLVDSRGFVVEFVDRAEILRRMQRDANGASAGADGAAAGKAVGQ